MMVAGKKNEDSREKIIRKEERKTYSSGEKFFSLIEMHNIYLASRILFRFVDRREMTCYVL